MLGVFLVIGACILWALDTLIRYPLVYSGINAFSIVFIEHAILSTLFLYAVIKLLKKIFKEKPVHIVYFLIIGGVGSALSTLAFTQAFKYLNPSLVILLQKFQPVIAIILARLILKEKIEKQFLFWAFTCLVGALTISYDDLQSVYTSYIVEGNDLFAPGMLQGYGLVAFSVIGWGSSTVFGKKLGQLGYKNSEIMGGRYFLGLMTLLTFLPIYTNPFSHEINIYVQVVAMALISGLFAMFLYYKGLRLLSARACSLTEMFFPFMAVLVNWYFLNATLSITQILGGLILLIGSFVIQLKHY